VTASGPLRPFAEPSLGTTRADDETRAAGVSGVVGSSCAPPKAPAKGQGWRREFLSFRWWKRVRRPARSYVAPPPPPPSDDGGDGGG
jgi:hypothetical protein